MSLQGSIYAVDEDDFAQTRGADDLFESEIQPATSASVLPNAPASRRASRGKDNPSRQRGMRGGRGGGHSDARNVHAQGKSHGTDGITEPASTGTSINAENKITPANRLLSGGVSKPKLSDEELAARMEKIRLNNQRLTERRRKAEEDETNYEKQEAARRQTDAKQRLEDRKKRIEAEKNRRELDEERERNRQKKLKAFQNREWDSEKKEEDYNPRSTPQYRRGAHGAIPGRYSNGPRSKVSNANRSSSSGNDAAAEWPSLPTTKIKDASRDATVSEERNDQSLKPVAETKADGVAEHLPMSPAVGSSSWADQVEDNSSAAPK